MDPARIPGPILLTLTLAACTRPHPPEGAAAPAIASATAPAAASPTPALGPARFLVAGRHLIDLASAVAVPSPAARDLRTAHAEGNDAFYLGLGNTLSAEDATTHHPRFSVPLSDDADAILAVGDTVFAIGARTVLGLDRATGRERFRRDIGHHLALRADHTPGPLDGPVAAGRSVAVADDEGNVYMVGPDGVVVSISPPPLLPPDPESPKGRPWVYSLISTPDGVCILTVEIPGSFLENRQHLRCVAADGTPRWEHPWKGSTSAATPRLVQTSAHHLLFASRETDSKHDISRLGIVYSLSDGSSVLESYSRLVAFAETPDGKLVGAFAPDGIPTLVDEKRAGRFVSVATPDASEPVFRIPAIGGGDGGLALGIDGDCVFAFTYRSAGLITLVRADLATGKERWRKEIELARELNEHVELPATLHRWGDHLAIRYTAKEGTGATVIDARTGESLLSVP